MVRLGRFLPTFIATILLVGGSARAPAQNADEPPRKPDAAESANVEPTKPAAGERLAAEERRVAERFRRLEALLLRMAELNAGTDPARAALLRKAVAQSKDRLIGVHLESIADLLKDEQLAKAVDRQGEVGKELQALLDLLMSENRAKRLESEKARLREYLKQLGTILNQQKELQGRTAGRDDPARLAAEQNLLTQKTERLRNAMQRREEGKAGSQEKPGEPKPHEGETKKPSNDDAGKKPAENGKKSSENGKKTTESDASPKKSSDDGKKRGGERSKAESKDRPSEKDAEKRSGNDGKSDGKNAKSSGKKSQGEKSDARDGKSKKSDGKSSKPGAPQEKSGEKSQETPQPSPSEPPSEAESAGKRLEAAKQRMQEAEKQLEAAKREKAVEKQEEAIRELEQAKAALERILRQLREEEKLRALTALEARLTRLLGLQRAVYEATVKLDKIPQAERTHDLAIEAGRLSGKETEIGSELDKALLILREEGTAVAFPEALSQARMDVEQVTRRLAAAKVDRMTQGLEEDVLAALEEMIAALKKAIKDLEKNKQQPQGAGRAMSPADQPLVDRLSEIKMIRSLQLRVNQRTERFSKMIPGEQAENAELLEALAQLAERQQRITKIVRELPKGKSP